MRKQRSPSELGFDRYDKRRLLRAVKAAKEKRLYIRLQAVLLVLEGMDIQKVAQLYLVSKRIVYSWLKVYLQHHQPSSLLDAPKSGRPPVAPAITPKRILQVLHQNPFSLGYRYNVWTVALLAQHLNGLYGCTISRYTLYRRMKAMGLECKRPRYIYEEKEVNRIQKKGRSHES
jgi:transposase